MNVRFLHDPSDRNRDKRAVIEFGGKAEGIDKERVLSSLETEIIPNGFVVNGQITQQNVGDFNYYQFFYFDGVNSRNMQLQIPRADSESNRRVERMRLQLEREAIKKAKAPYQKLKVFGEKALAVIAAGVVLSTIVIGGTVILLKADQKEWEAHNDYIQSIIPEEMKEYLAQQEKDANKEVEILFEETPKALK